MIVDAFLFFNLYHILLFRLNYLNLIVDKFFIFLTNRTFANNEKDYNLKSILSLSWIAPYLHKILYIQLDISKFITDKLSPWDILHLHRNLFGSYIKKHYTFLKGTLMFFGDIDEIPKITGDIYLIFDTTVDIYNLGIVYDQIQFHYSLNILSDLIKVDWSGRDRYKSYYDIGGIVYNARGTALINYDTLLVSNTSFQNLRDLAHHANIKRSFNPIGKYGSMGWHFSSIGNASSIMYKLNNLAHITDGIQINTIDQMNKLLANGVHYAHLHNKVKHKGIRLKIINIYLNLLLYPPNIIKFIQKYPNFVAPYTMDESV